MKNLHGRRKRRLVPGMTRLETRRVLTAVVTSLGQDSHDIVGPDASQGPDGIQDLHLRLSDLSGTVSSISIVAPGGFAWATEPDPSGYALAEFFASSTPGDGDLYINPQIDSDVSSTGAALPLGGSTGSLIQLVNGTPLTVTINYQGQSSPDVVTVPVSNLVSATNPMPATPAPANVLSGFSITDLGQDATGLYYEQGYVHLVATAPAGVTLSPATFNEISWDLSDVAGQNWDSTYASQGHEHVYATLRSGTDNTVDIYFPPVRNEAPPQGTTSPTMTLTAVLPGNPAPYVTSFAGADWNLALLTEAVNSHTPPTIPTTEAQLLADIDSESPEYDVIELPANQTIVITQPIEIPHSLTIIGNGATLLFDQGDTAAWPASASGAIYAANGGYTDIQLAMEDFTIRFDMSEPIRWSNPAGDTPALFDPENNPDGVTKAVIDLIDSNDNRNIDILTLSGMTIDGPPAFDSSSYGSLQAELLATYGPDYQYSGEMAISLVRSNFADSGYITGNTFQGGTVELFGGPWTVTNNTVLGSMPDTYSPGAFALHSAHDVLLQGNTVTQADPAGTEFRLVILASAGTDETIVDNSFGGGAGSVGNELTYDASASQFSGINDPEVILAESSETLLFEGRPSAISADGRLLELTNLRAGAAVSETGPGLVVSILSGVAADGSADDGLAGEWFPVAQQVSLSSDGSTIELLMQDPLPTPPAGGYYVIEVTGGFISNSIVGNTLNLTGMSSTGVKLDGEDYGTTISGNTFIGGTIYNDGYTGSAIHVGAGINSAASGSGAFPLPQGWTALPDLGTTITGNTIIDSLGGITIGLENTINYWLSEVSSASETGRVFVTATVADNSFEYNSAFLASWQSAYVADGNDPSQSSMPPTVTVGSGFSAEAPGPYGSPRFPWTVGDATRLYGSDQPVFVDPITNQVSMSGNSVSLISSAGVVSVQSGPSGQVYAGVINGTAFAPQLAPETFNGQPYNPFNLDNLDIDDPTGPMDVSPHFVSTPTPTPSPSPTPPVTPTPTPSPNVVPASVVSPTPTTTPSPTPTPTPTPSSTTISTVESNPSQVSALGSQPGRHHRKERSKAHHGALSSAKSVLERLLFRR